jgi:hypothetical protein
MPEGQWAFLDSKGPRKKITLLVSPEAYLLLKVAGAAFGTSPTGKAVDVVERWAEAFLERHADELADGVAEERDRRTGERPRVQGSTSSGQSVHGGE